MIPDFSHSIKNLDNQQGRVRTQQFFFIGPISFLCYEESLLSSNLNSKLLRFHCAHPNVNTKEKSIK